MKSLKINNIEYMSVITNTQNITQTLSLSLQQTKDHITTTLAHYRTDLHLYHHHISTALQQLTQNHIDQTLIHQQ